jgi:hypothetical protein
MKHSLLMLLALYCAGITMAQDSTKSEKGDTLKVGNFIIIKKKKKVHQADSSVGDVNATIDISIGEDDDSGSRQSYSSTNWFIFDLGFANLRDQTVYGSPEANVYLNANGGPAFSAYDLDLNTGKSSNINLWFFMQKLNVSKHVLNLKYGLGMEMYNFRYKRAISYHDDPSYIFRDSVSFSKNKLFVNYLTVPFMINIDPTPDKKRGFSMSAGVSAGYRIGSRNKQVSDERGKEKIKGDFDLEPWRFAYVAEMGIGPVRVYGSYSINPLHQNGLNQYPYTVGLRLSNW